MRVIELDAANWKSPRDFYDAILSAIGAPAEHGRSVDALLEGMIWGGMGTLEPPYKVNISNLKDAPADVVQYVRDVQRYVAEARQEFQKRNGRDVEVMIEISP